MIHPVSRRKTFCLFALAASLLSAPVGLRADIFSIWPFGGGASAGSPDISAESAEDTLATLLDATQFWSEKVSINGKDMTMKISMSDQSLPLVRSSVLKLFPTAQAAGNESSLLLRRPLEDGGSQRIFLLQLRGMNPLLQFTTVLPKDMPRECPRSLWPAEFPVAPGATAFQLMKFPNRGSLFGTYEIANSEVAPVMDDLVAKIRNAGWAPATMEHADLFAGSGEVFMKKDPDALLLLGIVRDAAGAAQVSFYTRKLK
jgi:hypothetical protein